MTTPPQPPNQPPGGPPGGGGFGPPPSDPPPSDRPPASGGPPAAPYGGGPYGAPPAQGGFGQPQAGGFGQPPGGPGPYGQPQPPMQPQPPTPPNNNKIVAIVVAAVVVVALAVGGTLLAVSGGDDDKGDKADAKKSSKSDGPSDDGTADDSSDSEDPPEPSPDPSESDATYKLAFPRTLENGAFTRRKDLSDQVSSDTPGEEAHMGSYAKNSDSTERLLYAAAKGNDFGNPDLSKDQMMKGMETSPAMDVAVKRRDITPDGAEDPLTCEVLVKTQQGRKLTIPVCAWSNPGTAAYVANDSLKTYSVAPKSVDLEDFADRVNTIRDEVRSPAE